MRLATEIYTQKVRESKEFYCQHFNFKVKFEMSGYVIIQHREHTAYELLFCVPNSPFVNKIFQAEFHSKGMIFQMEVENVVSEYERIRQSDIPVIIGLVSEPVNGEHFTIIDPNGIYIDIVETR